MTNSYEVFDHIETLPGGREELITQIKPDFPYIGIRSEHDRYVEHSVAWHWHQEVELFYVESGKIDYMTPHEHVVIEPGTVGFVNANVLHATKAHADTPNSNLLIHMFRPALLAEPNSRMYKASIAPLLAATSIELCVVTPEDKGGKKLCDMVKRSFKTYEMGAANWEMHLRDEIAEIWLAFSARLADRVQDGPMHMPSAADERLKDMMSYVGEHYYEHIGVPDIAESAFASERECHRTFKSALGVTPSQYLRDYRVQQACRMLVHTTRPLSQIGEQSGLGSPSHFGQVFREALGCTPREYRKRWQNNDSIIATE